MASGVTIEFKSDKLKAAFKQAGHRADHMESIWDDIGEALRKSVTENFKQQGRPEKWKPLKEATLFARGGGKRKTHTKKGKLNARGRKFISGAKILKNSGQLQDSITYHARDDGVMIGSNLDYAATHQFGRNFGRGSPIPARPYLIIQPEDEEMIADKIEGFLIKPLR